MKTGNQGQQHSGKHKGRKAQKQRSIDGQVQGWKKRTQRNKSYWSDAEKFKIKSTFGPFPKQPYRDREIKTENKRRCIEHAKSPAIKPDEKN